MNSAPPKSKDQVQVIAVEDGVTIRLPRRTLDDPALLTDRLRKVQYVDTYIVSLLILGTISLTIAAVVQDLKTALLVVLPIVLGCYFMIFRTRRLTLIAAGKQQTQGEIQIVSGQLIVHERTPYRDRWFHRMSWPTTKKFDPLDIGRLRIERTKAIVVVGGDSSRDQDPGPYLWLFLNDIDYSLIADDHDGRVRSIVAHAYPRETLIELARKLKKQLDGYRAEYDRQLTTANPGIKLPDYGDGIPIGFGARLREPTQKPSRPAWSSVTIERQDHDVVICVPRGGEMEAIEFRARRQQLIVLRKLLLGKIQHVIESHHLRKIYVRFQDMTDYDDVRLVIEYYDPATRSLETLDLLSYLSTTEICWVAAELREACPPTEKQEEVAGKSRFQYSIAHLLYATTLVCVFFACASTITPWGWIFGLQAVAAILCITSFTGIRILAPYTNRSWNRTEIVITCVIAACLCVMWVFRYASGQ